MATYTKSQITIEGNNTLIRAIQEQGEITFTRLSITDYEIETSEIPFTTANSNIPWKENTTNISAVLGLNTIEDPVLGGDTAVTNTINVSGSFSATDDVVYRPEGFYLNTIGLFAKLNDEDEILFAMSLAAIPDFLPAFSNHTNSTVNLSFVLGLSYSFQTLIKIISSASVTTGQFQTLTDIVNNHETAIVSNNNKILDNTLDIIDHETRIASNEANIGLLKWEPYTDITPLANWTGKIRCRKCPALRILEISSYGLVCGTASTGTVVAWLPADSKPVETSPILVRSSIGNRCGGYLLCGSQGDIMITGDGGERLATGSGVMFTAYLRY